MSAVALMLSSLIAFAPFAQANGRSTSLKDTPQAAPFNWNRCYLGAFVGGAWGDDVGATEARAPDGTFYNDPGASYGYGLGRAGTFGGIIGCNFHAPSARTLIGIEGELGGLRLSGSGLDPNSSNSAFDTIDSTRIGDWYGVIAGRFGVTFDSSLLYLKVGAAFHDVDSNIIDTCSAAPCGPATLDASGGSRDPTWAIGGGLEYALSNNWTIRGEYLFFDQQDYQVCGPVTIGGGVVGDVCSRHEIDGIHTFKLGVSYLFGR